MTKKNQAQVYLEQIERLDTIIHNKLIEKQQWHDLAVSITAAMDGERVQSSGAKSKMANAVEKCVDCEAEIEAEVVKLVRQKKAAVQVIERLDSPTEYKLLHLRYVQYIPLEDIALRWGKAYTSITTTHGRALKSVLKMLEQEKNQRFVTSCD